MITLTLGSDKLLSFCPFQVPLCNGHFDILFGVSHIPLLSVRFSYFSCFGTPRQFGCATRMLQHKHGWTDPVGNGSCHLPSMSHLWHNLSLAHSALWIFFFLFPIHHVQLCAMCLFRLCRKLFLSWHMTNITGLWANMMQALKRG